MNPTKIIEASEDDELFDLQREMRTIDPASVKKFLDDNIVWMLGMWVIVDYSDFTGTALDRANAAYFLKKYPGIVSRNEFQRFNDVIVGIDQKDLGNISGDALHFLSLDLQTLENEGVLDTELYKKIQNEKITETWVNWASKNFRHDLIQKFQNRREQIENLSEPRLWALFDQARDTSGEEWVEQDGAEQTIDIGEVTNAVTEEMLNRWLGAQHQPESASSEVLAILGRFSENLLEDRQYSCLMAPAPPKLTDAVIRWGQMFVQDDELYTDPQDPDGYGREDEVHVTVKFGLHDAEPSKELLRIIEATQPFEIEVGPCTLFENEKYDVVKFDVDGDGLRELNRRVSELPNSDEHPEYHPHLTVAYVVKEACHELIGKPLLDPKTELDLRFVVKSVIFSSPNKNKTTLFLGKPNLEEAQNINSGDEADMRTAKEVYAPMDYESHDALVAQLMPHVDFKKDDSWIDSPDGRYALEWEWWGESCVEDAIRRGRLNLSTDYDWLGDEEKERIFAVELKHRMPALATNKKPIKIWWEFRDDGPPGYDAIGFILWRMKQPGRASKAHPD